ncbi:hypothetical protein [Bradyrhizobium sp. 170]|uniref:hypothetical protein n=1 Tax=Bradyrhizobium sp. 170 TaxID=2782641 RepID=UPI001FFEE53E|nr:hypothetical protein [Bradyrhizobium sp. 170]UPK00591.1 hypothetical protein IVB05_22865 [Bradyrhizobium sp. 170]
MTTYQRAFYRIGQASGIVLVIGFFWWAELQMNYVGWPNFPQFEIGLTVNGIVVYTSPKDAEFSRHLIRTMIVSGALMIICLVFSGELNRMLNRPKPPLPPEY